MQHRKWDNNTKRWAVEQVKNGKTLIHVAKSLNTYPSMIKSWCEKEGVKSNHALSPDRRHTDEEIISFIKKMRVVTCRQVAEEFGYATGINTRLFRMLMKGKIKSKRIPKLRRSRKIKKPIAAIMNRRLYYVDEKAFEEWILEQIPKDVPRHIKRVYTSILNDIGIKPSAIRDDNS